MSDAPDDAPPWHLLPDDPLGFFGLGPDDDERELKRRYGRLIKRFKPERDPEAFQRIRAAYEALTENRPRRAAAPWASPRPPLAAPVDPAHDPAGRSARSVDDAAPRALERLEGAPPGEVATWLASLGDKAPGDFAALALLAGVDGAPPGRDALSWLLEGLRRWPGDAQLLALLAAYLSAEVPAADAGHALRRCAGALDRPTFYRVTLPLWRRWLREGGASDAPAALADCERVLPLGDRGVEPWFLRGLLRGVALRGDDAFSNDLLQRLEQRHAEVPDVDFELERAQALRAYRQVRTAFLASNDPLRGQLDRALHALAEGSPGDVTDLHAVLIAAAADPLRAMTSLPAHDEPARRVVGALQWLCLDLRRQGLGRRPALTAVPRTALERIAALHRQDPLRIALVTLAFVSPVLVVLAVAAAVIGIAVVFGPRAIVPLAIGMAMGLARIFEDVGKAMFDCVARADRFARRRTWGRQRVALARLLAWSHLELEQALGQLAARGEDVEDLAAAAREDPGVALVSLAQRFAHA